MRILGVCCVLLFAPQLAHGEEACLSTVAPRITDRGQDGCRFEAAIQNACGRVVRYAIVRATPDPRRGPLPTVTASIERFRLAPLVFEHEACDQILHLLEIGPDGVPKDVTATAITPALPLNETADRAKRVNACVAQCPPPVSERASIIDELRARYRHALDDPNGQGAVNTMVAALQEERAAKDRICAAQCQGTVTQADAPGRLKAIEDARVLATSAAAAALAAIAARPPPAPPPDPVMTEQEPEPEADTGPRRGHTERSVSTLQNCHATRHGQRCSFALDIGRPQAQQPRRHRRPPQKF